ncbi:MAG TPA: NHL repeat-containing protein [bacterium]|nr:NHL repeat-containing protein [bacterium]HOL48467.1 NHL repeat-containing protein [bacterium]
MKISINILIMIISIFIKFIYCALPSDTIADFVWGQPDFNSSEYNYYGLSNKSLFQPFGLFVDISENKLYIADNGNNRVLVYDISGADDENKKEADWVYGQPNFSWRGENSYGLGEWSLKMPTNVYVDNSENKIFIVDCNNNRVLEYTLNSDTYADNLYGHLSDEFRTRQEPNYYGVSSQSLGYPIGVHYVNDGGTRRLFIADAANNRVLVYLNGSTTATKVYGQKGSFTTNTSNINGSVDAEGLYCPMDVFYDTEQQILFVSDSFNNRVLAYNYNDGDLIADTVYGQPDFNSSNASAGNSGLNKPHGIWYCNKSKTLWVADTGNNRVLVYSANSTTADTVFGQSDFNETSSGTSNTKMNGPRDVYFDFTNGKLYVSDYGNNRVLRFD